MYINNSDHKKKSPKSSTDNPNFEIYIQFFIARDEYYFVTNVFHMLKFTNVYWSFLKNDCLKSKFNPIYFKPTKIIQNVMSILTSKTKYRNAIFLTTIFGGHVFLPYKPNFYYGAPLVNFPKSLYLPLINNHKILILT
jgi:hypothetical protein